MATDIELLSMIKQINSVDTLRELFAAIADALRRKGVEQDTIYPAEYPGLIDNITTIDAGTEDATAANTDIASGKTAYARGSKLVGNVPVIAAQNDYSSDATSVSIDGQKLKLNHNVPTNVLLRKNAQVNLTSPLTDFGDAAVTDVANGKIFTSSEGLKVSGTLSEVKASSVYMAGNAEDLAVISGKDLRVNIKLSVDKLMRTDSIFSTYVALSNLGNAATDDVVRGKTFTSSAGLKAVGTMPEVTMSTPSMSMSENSNGGATVTSSVTCGTGHHTSETKSNTYTIPAAGTITGDLGVTGGASWSTSDPNRGSGTVTIVNVNQTAGYTKGHSNSDIIVNVTANHLLKGRTVTPTTTEQVIANAEDIAYNTIKVAGDANLIPANIRSGKSIFGVSGTLEAGSNTSDATAIASDVVSGKIFYGADGRATGKVSQVVSGSTYSLASATPSISGSYFYLKKTMPGDVLLRTGSTVSTYCTKTQLGDAAASDVVSGKTFTSTNGLAISGTVVELGGSNNVGETFGNVSLSGTDTSSRTITIPFTKDRLIRSGYNLRATLQASSDFGDAWASHVLAGKTFTSSVGFKVTGMLVPGTDTSDATAANTDIASGKTAYVNGSKITGNLTEVANGSSYSLSSATPSISGSYFYLTKAMTVNRILRTGAEVNLYCTKSQLGTAAASDVVSGKTFTSTNGLAISGSITEVADGSTYSAGSTTDLSVSGSYLYVKKALTAARLMRSGAIFSTYTTLSNLGNATASDVASGKTFTSSAGLKVTGTMANAGTISGELGSTGSAKWDTSDPNRGSGIVSIKNVSQNAGYTSGYTGTGTISGIVVPANRLLKGRTVTPTTTEQTIGNAEDILYGAIKVAGDANLIPANIVSGKSIFGVSGTAVSANGLISINPITSFYIRFTGSGSLTVAISYASNSGSNNAPCMTNTSYTLSSSSSYTSITAVKYLPASIYFIVSSSSASNYTASVTGARALALNNAMNTTINGTQVYLKFYSLYDPSASSVYVTIS